MGGGGGTTPPVAQPLDIRCMKQTGLHEGYLRDSVVSYIEMLFEIVGKCPFTIRGAENGHTLTRNSLV